MVIVCFASAVTAGLRPAATDVCVRPRTLPCNYPGLPYNYQSDVLMERANDVGAVHVSAVLHNGAAEKAVCYADI